MTFATKFLTGMIALGAGYLVVSNPTGVFNAAKSIQKVVGGTTTQIVTGGKSTGAL